jgi:hypothetical protein
MQDSECAIDNPLPNSIFMLFDVVIAFGCHIMTPFNTCHVIVVWLFTLLLHCGYFHHSTEIATLEIDEKLYSMPHELLHQHESGLLGRRKPEDQVVAYIGEPGNSLEVVPDRFVKVCLCTICIVWALLHDDTGPFGQAYILKALTH